MFLLPIDAKNLYTKSSIFPTIQGQHLGVGFVVQF